MGSGILSYIFSIFPCAEFVFSLSWSFCVGRLQTLTQPQVAFGRRARVWVKFVWGGCSPSSVAILMKYTFRKWSGLWQVCMRNQTRSAWYVVRLKMRRSKCGCCKKYLLTGRDTQEIVDGDESDHKLVGQYHCLTYVMICQSKCKV